MAKYQFGSMISSILVSIIWVYKSRVEAGSYWTIQIIFITQFLSAIYSIFEAYRVLGRPGISGSARTLILRRHATGIIIFFVCNIYVFSFTVYKSYGIPLDVKTTPWWQIVLKSLYLTQGVVGPLIRCNEEAFRATVLKTIKKDLGLKDSNKNTSLNPRSEELTEQDSEMAPLFLFLASSFNTELVYVILKGITQFSYFSSQKDEDTRRSEVFRHEKTNGDLTIFLSQIKIKDFYKWS